MGPELTRRRTLDVSGLPTVVFGTRTLLWFGTMGIAAIEGMVFAIVIAAYFFLRLRVTDWPPGVLPPYLLYGTLNTVLFLVSLFPNHILKKAAKEGELKKVQVLLIVLTLFAVGNLVLRVFEFPSLGIKWNANAYGSVVWIILGLHTVHLITDWFDTVVLTLLMFTDKVEGKRFMDVYENSDYWYFVVWTWLPIYFVLYWAPRII
jgi:cytochrome c oxidase subunit III